MREILTITANHGAAYLVDRTLKPLVELIFVAIEPSYSLAPDGDTLVRGATITSHRFDVDPDRLRKLATTLCQLADEAEALIAGREKPPLPAA